MLIRKEEEPTDFQKLLREHAVVFIAKRPNEQGINTGFMNSLS